MNTATPCRAPVHSRSFKQVDVFTAVPFKGNPVAVILDAEGLEDDHMQQIARWTNLSETTFVLPPSAPDADYQLRIFTPRAELPFAGHPTLGTAHALLEAGLIQAHEGHLVQQCRAGLVTLKISETPGSPRSLAFQLPSPTISPLTEAQQCVLENILGHPVLRDPAPCLIEAGPRWVIAQLADAATVLALKPDLAQLREHDLRNGFTGLTVFGAYPKGQTPNIETRSFVPAHGVDEDPVCGSGNGCVGVFIQHTGQTDILGNTIISGQGQRLGRAGRVRLNLNGDRVWVGGNAVTCIDGVLNMHDFCTSTQPDGSMVSPSPF